MGNKPSLGVSKTEVINDNNHNQQNNNGNNGFGRSFSMDFNAKTNGEENKNLFSMNKDNNSSSQFGINNTTTNSMNSNRFGTNNTNPFGMNQNNSFGASSGNGGGNSWGFNSNSNL